MMTECLVDPVHARVLEGILAAAKGRHGVGIVAGSLAFVGKCLVHSRSIGSTVNELRTIRLIVDEMVVVNRHLAGIILTALGGDENGAVGSLVAVKRCGCGILEDGNGLHLFGGYHGNLTLYTVYQNQGIAGAQALESAHIESRILSKIGARSVKRDKSVAPSKNRVTDILRRTLIYLIISNDRH